MYNKFSYVYDYFMDNIPYDKWVQNILIILKNNNCQPKTIVDLGCGTGTVALKLSKKGYNVLGIDLSSDMISLANKKINNNIKNKLSFKVGDITNFILQQNVDCIISTCDSFNYILNDEDLLKSFKIINKYLNDGGIFIFDMNTEHYFKETLGECMYSDVALDSAYIIENYYDELKKINTYELNLFIENEEGLFERSIEIHKEKARYIKDVISLLKKANLNCVDVLNTEDLNPATNLCDRIYFVCKKGEVNG